MNPRIYQTQAERVTAKMCGESAAMDAAAEDVRAAIRREASRYVDTGSYIDAFKIQKVPGIQGYGRNIEDRLVYNDDPAALPQEFGRMTRAGRIHGRHIMQRGLRGA